MIRRRGWPFSSAGERRAAAKVGIAAATPWARNSADGERRGQGRIGIDRVDRIDEADDFRQSWFATVRDALAYASGWCAA